MKEREGEGVGENERGELSKRIIEKGECVRGRENEFLSMEQWC